MSHILCVFRLIVIVFAFAAVSSLDVLAGGPWSEATAEEPAFCDPDRFMSFEETPVVRGIDRLRVFRIGRLTLAGMAIGASEASDVIGLAETYSVTADDHYCTWYVNKGNKEAEAEFNFRYVSNPLYSSPSRAAKEFMGTLDSSFKGGPGVPSFWSCAINQGYIAMGCNGQMHRGPSVFGMILAFSGCSSEHALTIANRIWGLNGVLPEVRLAIIQAARDFGDSRPDLRAKLLGVMLSEVPSFALP
ncbi:MAG TPA: hypothetical protein VJB59_07410 [Bdellovibrionota bacterium]|nr:hypothetical protein [Bdellovibrionota bacterium]